MKQPDKLKLKQEILKLLDDHKKDMQTYVKAGLPTDFLSHVLSMKINWLRNDVLRVFRKYR